MSATVQREGPRRRMARARIGFAYLGIEPSPRLVQLLSRRVTIKDLPTDETMDAFVGRALAKDAYIGPYLVYDAE